jgi:adenine/guanine phosphoribosyltransferase-like PRPP-binding protein
MNENDLKYADPTTPVARYERSAEQPGATTPGPLIPVAGRKAAIAASSLTPGGRALATALLRTSRPRIFPGGGLGIEYGALLKTAARPDLLAPHIAGVVAHLRSAQIDILFVPGMSGYPIGAMYSQASGIPALLLKKQPFPATPETELVPGAFVIPSYTGAGDTLISADTAAAADILAAIIDRQLAEQADARAVEIIVRIAGADEIIDKATMATAITETAPVFCQAVIETLLSARQDQTNDRPVKITATVDAWVTPLLKGYNGAAEILRSRCGITPFAGVTITSLHVDPPAIGIEGIGVLACEEP